MTPTAGCSTVPSSCWSAAGATSATPWPCSCPRRGKPTATWIPAVRGFYRYHACLIEPWDGPAGIVFTDGLGVGAALDRNGLRPLRYAVCEDGLVACCSEAGAVDVHGHGRVTGAGSVRARCSSSTRPAGVLTDEECKQRLAAAGPFARWAADGLTPLRRSAPVTETPDARPPGPPPGHARLHRRRAAHGHQADGRRRQGADVRHGRRRPATRLSAGRADRWPTSSASASPRSPTRRSTISGSGWS